MPLLPEAGRAIIEPKKLRDYVLSPDHAHSQHRARVLVSALGIEQDSWEYLYEQIVGA